MFQQEEIVGEIGNLRKFALRLTKNAHDADDLVQSTLLRALEKKEYFQNDTNLFSWASKIMFNLFVSSYRQKKKFETQYDPAPYIETMSAGPAQEANADLAIVGHSMQQLSPEHREILMLVCVQGMRYEEASEMLQVPVGTVRSRLSRARKQLQDMLTTPPDHPLGLALPHLAQQQLNQNAWAQNARAA
jgi:RNA polymerase sigma-70 factor (ECF subfamily)